MLENKKVIIFDLDGTLIDSIGIWNDIDRKLIETLGTVEFDNVNIGKQRDTKLKEFSKSVNRCIIFIIHNQNIFPYA